MAKKPTKKNRGARRDEPMNRATAIFFAGCAVELYLMMIRRYYLNGNIDQLLLWDTLLKVFTVCGAAAAAGGAVWIALRKRAGKRLLPPLALFAAGLVFFALSALALWKMTLLTPLLALVPIGMILALLWVLYDRECALALTVLGISLTGLWALRRVYHHAVYASPARVLLILYVLLLAVLVFLARTNRLARFLPGIRDPLPLYIASALSAAAIAAALLSASVAYYAMWALAMAIFALAVYYTVRQL